MNSKLPLILLLGATILFSSCKKDLIGFKSPKISDVNVEEIDFHYMQTSKEADNQIADAPTQKKIVEFKVGNIIFNDEKTVKVEQDSNH